MCVRISISENGKYEVQIKGKYEFSGVGKVDAEAEEGSPTHNECRDIENKYRYGDLTGTGATAASPTGTSRS